MDYNVLENEIRILKVLLKFLLKTFFYLQGGDQVVAGPSAYQADNSENH